MAIVHVYPSESELHNVISIQHVAVAQALYPQASKFNHSCNPNSFSSYFKRTLRVHATQDLTAFTPLELSYGPQVGEAGRCERQEWLRDRYYFNCKCESCMRGTFSDILDSGYRCGISSCKGIVLHGNIEDAKQVLLNHDVANLLSRICGISVQNKDIPNLQGGCCLKCKSVVDVEQAATASKRCMEDFQSLELNLAQVEARELLSNALRCLEQGRKCFHPFNKRMAKMEDFVARMYCESHQPLNALEHAKESIKIIECLYGKDHIAVAYERAKLSSVAKLAGVSDITRECTEIVNNIFTTYYGGDYAKVFPHLKRLINDS